MEKLALFDIDYTITRKETLMQFFKYMVFKDCKNIIYIPRAIYCGLMFSIKVYDERKVKETFLKFIKNKKRDELSEITKDFYERVLKNILYKDALDMMKKLKAEGYLIYLISASPEFYINEFYNIAEVDHIIGTRFCFDNEIFMTKMDGENCKGKEKVQRLKEFLKEKNINVDFKNSYMFSDSLSDKPLLDLVGNGYLINYRKNSSFKVLKWK